MFTYRLLVIGYKSFVILRRMGHRGKGEGGSVCGGD